MNANHQITQLIKLAETYGRHRRLALSSVSVYAGGQGRLFERLKEGKQITFGRAERLVQWFSDNWLDDKPWPKGIKRPSRSKKRRAA